MDILLLGSVTGTTLIGLRVVLFFLACLFLFSIYKYWRKTFADYKGDIEIIDHVVDVARKKFVSVIAFFIIVSVLGFTFQSSSAYTPKLRVVEQSSTEMEKQYVERNAKLAEQGVKQSEADAKAAARKGDVNIREKFEQLPDK